MYNYIYIFTVMYLSGISHQMLSAIKNYKCVQLYKECSGDLIIPENNNATEISDIKGGTCKTMLFTLPTNTSCKISPQNSVMGYVEW